MKAKPIPFNSDGVRAILDDRKIMTRRPINPQPRGIVTERHCHETHNNNAIWIYHGWPHKVKFVNIEQGHRLAALKCPYGKIEDRLWVRETFAIESNFQVAEIMEYKPPFNDERPIRWYDDLENGKCWDQCHYRATDLTPELSYEDREGPCVKWKPSIHMPKWASRITLEIVDIRVERLQEITEEDAIKEGIDSNYIEKTAPFAELWDSIYGKKYSWDNDPWLWVIEFKRIK